ncbi:MAG: hypothetical protein HC933_19660 [Pleurocapsa sp. SU_196_0]|nr:hypothetical protein [Pleurocapsa sp. SU_196_0]
MKNSSSNATEPPSAITSRSKKRDSEKLEGAIERFNTALEKALSETGMTEDEFFDALEKAGNH